MELDRLLCAPCQTIAVTSVREPKGAVAAVVRGSDGTAAKECTKYTQGAGSSLESGSGRLCRQESGAQPIWGIRSPC